MPLKFLGWLIFSLIILNFYKFYLWLKKRSGFLGLTRGRILSLFTNRFLIHSLIIVIALIVLFNNRVYAITNEPTQGNDLLSSLVAASDESEASLIEEESAAPKVVANNFLDQAGALRVVPQTNNEELVNSSMIASAGTALLKPNLPTMAGERLRDKTETYQVADGDTVSTIAEKFGVSIDTILLENKLSQNDYIRPGQTLTILPVTGVSHRVGRGETLATIAKKYNVDSSEIIDFNRLVDATDISPGEVLIIPGGRITYSYTPPKPRLASFSDIFSPPVTINPTFNLGMIWPAVTKRITQYFSWRHSGIDIASGFGLPIRAAADGIVEKSLCTRWDYGCHIVIDHGRGVKTLYGHASRLLVQVGQAVKQGEVIAEEGSTGRSTGPHLHFEVWINGRKLNPFMFVK